MVSALTMAFSACGDSGSTDTPKGPDMSVATMEDLPNCTENREGVTALVTEDNSTYECKSGKWTFVSAPMQTVETLDDLLACVAKREGNTSYITKEQALYRCEDGSWKKMISFMDDVKTRDDLPNCTEKREGNNAFVTAERVALLCSGGMWLPYDIYKETDEKNLPESSSDFNPFNPDIDYGELTDSRDGQTYKTVKIGDQVWMAENLNFETDSSICYNNKESNCIKYGRLYRWAAAVGKSESECGYGKTCSLPSGNIQGVCPNGWHLPDTTEWITLVDVVGKVYVEFKSMVDVVLKSMSGWGPGKNGLNASGFSALPAGIVAADRRIDGKFFFGEGTETYFWSSSESGSNDAYYTYLDDVGNYRVDSDWHGKDYWFSVRCLKDSAE